MISTQNKVASKQGRIRHVLLRNYTCNYEQNEPMINENDKINDTRTNELNAVDELIVELSVALKADPIVNELKDEPMPQKHGCAKKIAKTNSTVEETPRNQTDIISNQPVSKTQQFQYWHSYPAYPQYTAHIPYPIYHSHPTSIAYPQHNYAVNRANYYHHMTHPPAYMNGGIYNQYSYPQQLSYQINHNYHNSMGQVQYEHLNSTNPNSTQHSHQQLSRLHQSTAHDPSIKKQLMIDKQQPDGGQNRESLSQSTKHKQHSAAQTEKSGVLWTSTLSISCCHDNLNPAPIPINPLEELSEQANSLQKEVAWLIEETAFVIPSMPEEKNVLLFDMAWIFGSLKLRQLLFQKQPSLATKKLNDPTRNRFTLIDADQLLFFDKKSKNYFLHLRKEAREGLNLGFRRSDSLGKLINKVRRFRLRKALEERGDNEDQALDALAMRKTRRKRRRKAKEADQWSKIAALSGRELEKIAMDKPSDLNDVEEEIAWLCEESLLLIPKFSAKQCSVSAGLMSEAPNVNWDYVTKYASQALRLEFQKTRGTIGNRTLQRVVRMSNTHVRVAFKKRREMIANLITLGQYRRNETRDVLPNQEALVQTGYIDILKAKLMRRMQQSFKTDELASDQDLRAACNRRLSDEASSSEKSPSNFKRRKRREKPPPSYSSQLQHQQLTAKSTQTPLSTDFAQKMLSVDQQQNRKSSVLTQNEEELAWLRVEYEIETGVKGYDWEYIEKFASEKLKEVMVERQVLFSSFPTIPGVSKLKAMIRLDNEDVYIEFRQKCRDVRWAIKNGYRRDLRKDALPNLPSAPPSIAGAHVKNIEYAFDCSDRQVSIFSLQSKGICCVASHEGLTTENAKRAASSCEDHDVGVDFAEMIGASTKKPSNHNISSVSNSSEQVIQSVDAYGLNTSHGLIDNGGECFKTPETADQHCPNQNFFNEDFSRSTDREAADDTSIDSDDEDFVVEDVDDDESSLEM